jgi:hypothetical protein
MALVSFVMRGLPLGAAPVAGQAPSTSVAQTPLRVLLLVDQPDDAFLERVRAEIAGLGLTVVTQAAQRNGDTEDPLEVMGRRQRAVAVVRMLHTRRGVEIWMADATSGRSLLRQIIVDESSGGPNEPLVALQTAELLRTSLLAEHRASSSGAMSAQGSSASAGIGSAPEGPARPPLASTSSFELGGQTALGALYSPGGAGGAFQLWVSPYIAFGRSWGVSLDMSAPLHSATLSGPEGSTSIGSYLAGATFYLRWRHRAGGLFANTGVGAGVMYLRAEGQPNAPEVGTSVSLVTGAGYLRADVGWAAASWLAIGARAVAGAAVDEVAVRFAGNDAGSWGRPFFGLFLVADVHAP